MINVFIIDDHKIIIDGIMALLEGNDEIEVVGFLMNPSIAQEQLEMANPDVLLLDINLPEINGIKLAEEIKKTFNSLKIIFLSTHMQTSIIKKALKSGGNGYVSKATGINAIADAITKVHKGELYLGPEVSSSVLLELNPEPNKGSKSNLIPVLTNREKQVLQLIANEATTEEISKALFISKNTVETHRKNLISKFQVRNSVGLVRAAMEFDMLD